MLAGLLAVGLPALAGGQGARPRVLDGDGPRHAPARGSCGTRRRSWPGRPGWPSLLLSRLVWGALSGMEVPLAASDRRGGRVGRRGGPAGARRRRPRARDARAPRGGPPGRAARARRGTLAGGAPSGRRGSGAIVAAGGRLQPRHGRPARAGDRRGQGRGRASRADRGPRERVDRGGGAGDGVPRRVGRGPVRGPSSRCPPSWWPGSIAARAGRLRWLAPALVLHPVAMALVAPVPGSRLSDGAVLGAPLAARRRRGGSRPRALPRRGSPRRDSAWPSRSRSSSGSPCGCPPRPTRTRGASRTSTRCR